MRNPIEEFKCFSVLLFFIGSMIIDVEKIIKKALGSWEYGLSGAEWGIEEEQKKLNLQP